MDKAARKAFERQMAQFNAEALAVFGIAQALLARADSPSAFNVPTSHHVHQADIVAEMVRNSPGLVGEVATLLALGEDVHARKRVKDALTTLRDVDPALFMRAPSPKLAALLAVGPNADVATWASAISSADWADNDTRRRNALAARRAMFAAGLTPPNEEDVAALMLASRDEAVAAMLKRGGGAVASRRA